MPLTFFDETSGLIHASFWISFVFAFTFECFKLKNIIKVMRNDINENSDEENEENFCDQIISGTPCVRCMKFLKHSF